MCSRCVFFLYTVYAEYRPACCCWVKSETCWHEEDLPWHSSGRRRVPVWVHSIVCLSVALTTLCYEKGLTMRQTFYALSHRQGYSYGCTLTLGYLYSCSVTPFFLWRGAQTLLCVAAESAAVVSRLFGGHLEQMVSNRSVWAHSWLFSYSRCGQNCSVQSEPLPWLEGGLK